MPKLPRAIRDYCFNLLTNYVHHHLMLVTFSFMQAISTSVSAEQMKTPQQHLAVASEEQVFIDGDPCHTMSVPDAPARALRLDGGGVYFLATNNRNIPLMGATLSTLRPQCQLKAMGSENADPNAFDDMYWVQAIALNAQHQIVGLASHDYNGQRHKGMCSSTERGACWYSSILLATAPKNGPFHLKSRTDRTIAVPQQPYDRNLTKRTGFFTTSNIVAYSGASYVIIYAENTAGIKSGNCLFKAQNPELTKWLALSGEGFNADFSSITNQSCTIIGPDIFHSPIRAIIWVEDLDSWVAVFQEGTGAEEGIYYSLSKDLVHWNNRSFLMQAAAPYGKPGCGKFYSYPSVISNDDGHTFDHAKNSFDLYMTRFDFDDCVRDHKKRDLVRWRIEVR